MDRKIQTTEQIKDREKICACLQVAAAFQSSVFIAKNATYSLLEEARISEVSPDRTQGYFCIQYNALSDAFPESEVQFRVTGEYCLMELSTMPLSSAGCLPGTYRFRLPEMLMIYYERRYHRIEPSDSRPVRVVILDRHLVGLSPLIRLVDISLGGLAFEMYDAQSIFRIGSRIEQMEISLPGEGECTVSGIVRFVCKNRCGVEFFGEGYSEKIERYLKQRQLIANVQKKTYKAVSDLESSMNIDAGKKKILVVDDSPVVQKKLYAFFTLHGLSVIQAFNGIEGVKQSVRSAPDLILMDISMPLMNGFECARLIRNHPKTCHIPICIFTSARDKDAILHAASMGISDYVMKTERDEEVLERVKKILFNE